MSWDRDKAEVDPASAGPGNPEVPPSPRYCRCWSDGYAGRARVVSGTLFGVWRQMAECARAPGGTVRGSVGGKSPVLFGMVRGSVSGVSRVMARTRPGVCRVVDGL